MMLMIMLINSIFGRGNETECTNLTARSASV